MMSGNDNLPVVELESVIRRRGGGSVVSLKDVMLGKVVVESADGKDQRKRRKRRKPEEEEQNEKDEEEEKEGEEEEKNEDEEEENRNAIVEEEEENQGEAEEEEEEEEDGDDDDDDGNDDDDGDNDDEERKAELDKINRVEGMRGARSRKRGRQKHVKTNWSFYETEMFFDNLRLFGTDFLLGSDKFPNRSHKQMVRKLRVEEKVNPQAVDWALANPFKIPDGIDPYKIPLPCQLEGYSNEDLEAYYKVLLETLERNEQDPSPAPPQE